MYVIKCKVHHKAFAYVGQTGRMIRTRVNQHKTLKCTNMTNVTRSEKIRHIVKTVYGAMRVFIVSTVKKYQNPVFVKLTSKNPTVWRSNYKLCCTAIYVNELCFGEQHSRANRIMGRGIRKRACAIICAG